MLVGLLAISIPCANAEDAKTPYTSVQSEDLKAPEKGIAQLVMLADELVERSTALQREIETFFDKSAAEAAWAEVGKSLTDLSGRFSKIETTKRYNYDQVVQIKTAALMEAKTVKRLSDSLHQSALQLEAWTTEWQREKKRWGELKSTLPKDAPQAMLKPVLTKGQQAIDSSLNLAIRQLGPLLEAQQKFADQRARLGKLVLDLDGMLQRAIKRDVFRRSAPSMLAFDYYSQLFKPHSYETANHLLELAAPAREYLSKYGWAVVLQVLAFLLIAHGIRRHRGFFEEYERWGFIATRPLAAGLFAAVIFLGWLPGAPVPMALRLVTLTLICLSTARLVGGLIQEARNRRLIYLLAVILIMTEVLRILDLPLPLFRLYIFFVALAGVLLGIRIALKRARTGDSPLLVWGFRAGTALFAVALFAELGGYNGLSSDLIECSLKSILSLSVCWMVMTLIRGALKWVLYTTRIRSIAILQNKAEVIIRRSTNTIGFFLGLFLISANLVIWGIYENPAAALNGFLSLGIGIGNRRITLGLVLTSGMIVYGSFLASWAAQAALTQGLFTKREVQMGARLSMARLIHYAFMLVGLLLTLAALGVDLQNITIIAGALGVGIGFGLQGIVNNFVCGLILLFERPIKVGDLVEIDTQWAQIKKIGLRATVVETFEQAEVVVPNSELVNNKVTNWTLTNRGSRLTIAVGVAYGSDVSQVLQILQECAEEHPLVLKSRQPSVLFMKFGDSSLDFELRVYSEVDYRLKIKSELLQAIDKRFREAGIEIPFPQRDLHIRSIDSSSIMEVRKPDASAMEKSRSFKAPGFLPSN
jgi:small-conductance mechanosensitive channel